MTYCDYDFYINQYHGKMSEEDFEREAAKASAYIDLITMSRITPEVFKKYEEKIKLATCAVTDTYHTESDGGELASQTVGSWTKTYKGSGKSTAQKLQDSAETYLLMTGLLYRGAVI